MNILCITTIFPNSKQRTIGSFNFQQIKGLSEIEDVEVIAPIPWVEYYRDKRKKIENNSGLKVYHPVFYYIPKFFRCLHGFFYFFSILRTLLYVKKTFHPDCIFSCYAFPDGFSSILAGFIFKIPVYIKVHGSDIHSISGVLKYKFTAWALNRCSKVFSVSLDLRNKILKMGVSNDKVFTIYNGIDRSKFKPRDKKTARKQLKISLYEKIILFVGNLVEIKNIDNLLFAFEKLETKPNEQIRLVIIGQGNLRDYLIDIAYRLNLSANKNITFKGVIDHKNIPIWMNASDVLCLPSYNEGVPNVVLEAMACGLPVVAANVGGIPEVLKEPETGYLVDPKNVGHISLALKKSIDQEWLSCEMVKYSKQYSWKNNALKIISKFDV